jgi:hypothetical protein
MLKREDPKKVQAKTAEDRMAALLAFRRSKGLCFTCGEKWTGRNHKCPDQVPIQVIQEVMEILQADSSSDCEIGDSEPDNIEDCLLSVQDSSDTPATVKRRKTMRFHGTTGKQDILILLDSGSADTFISEHVAQHFKSTLQACAELQFSTADGSPMVSNTHILSSSGVSRDTHSLILQEYYL